MTIFGRLVAITLASAILAVPLLATFTISAHVAGNHVGDNDFWFIYWAMAAGLFSALVAITPWERQP